MLISLARYGAVTKTFRYAFLAAALSGLAACGGGGGSSSSVDPLPGGGTDKPGGGGGGGGISTVTITWEQPTTNLNGSALDDLAGYRIYWGSEPGLYTESVEVSDPATLSHTMPAPSPGTYYFAATAYDGDANESPYSEMASIVID